MPAEPGNRIDQKEGGASPPIRVFVIGGTALFRAGLRALIGEADGLECAGCCATLVDWQKDAIDESSNVILLDVMNFQDDIPGALRDIRSRNGAARILIVTNHADSEGSQRMVIAGASGVILKDAPPDQLLYAIRKIHAGELWFDRVMTGRIITDIVTRRHRLVDDPERAKIDSLTRREHEVATLVAEGLGNRAIATRLSITETTVRHHLTSVYEKLNVPDRTGLVIYAIRHKLASA